MSERACPCGRRLTYEACCGRFHRGAEPTDAETLMRSRYSAFVLRNAAHLYRTLHPEHDDHRQGEAACVRALKKHFGGQLVYKGLEILDVEQPDPAGVERVLFIARIMHRGRDASFAECSTFARHDGALRYLAGRTVTLGTLGQVRTIDAFDRLRS